MPSLFDKLTIRGTTFRNRIFVSPMCQYSCTNGLATDWHLVHLGSRAVGGAAMVMVEATAVTADGRISAEDMGIWSDEHIEPLARIARFVESQGAVPAIQLAHSGRKASTLPPWIQKGRPLPIEKGGWPVVGPSPIAFDEDSQVPHELTKAEIAEVVQRFSDAAKRALAAGFKLIEIHGAHGYLLHSFLSPLSNQRNDEYGQNFEGRSKIVDEVISCVRKIVPDDLPLFLRLSCSDWAEGGWDIEGSVALAEKAKTLGVDLIDCSSGGLVPHVKIPVRPGYQVPFAERIRKDADIMTGAVGLITEAKQADEIIRSGKSDVVLLARQFLRDPYFPLRAAIELDAEIEWPKQYGRAK